MSLQHDRSGDLAARSKDTGGALFVGGAYYYRQIDDLCMNICVAKKIDDSQWREFLEGSLRMTDQIGCQGKVTIASFAHAHPSAVQRRFTSEFLEKHRVPLVTRMAVVSDSPLLRGAVTAFSWIVPKMAMRSFAPRDFDGSIKWLKEAGAFDLSVALTAWQEGLAQLSR